MDNVLQFPCRTIDMDIADVHKVICTSRNATTVGRAYIVLARLEYIKMSIHNGTNDSKHYDNEGNFTAINNVVYLKAA